MNINDYDEQPGKYWVDRLMREGEVAEPNWVVHKASDGKFLLWCPACKCCHWFNDKLWSFNGDMIKPTVLPALGSGFRSIITHGWSPEKKKMIVCHFNIDNGLLMYHNDSEHELKGKTIAMEPF